MSKMKTAPAGLPVERSTRVVVEGTDLLDAIDESAADARRTRTAHIAFLLEEAMVREGRLVDPTSEGVAS